MKIYGNRAAAEYVVKNKIRKTCTRQYITQLVNEKKLNPGKEKIPVQPRPINVFESEDLERLRK